MDTQKQKSDSWLRHCAEIGESDLARARALADAKQMTLDRAVLTLALLPEYEVLEALAKELRIDQISGLHDVDSRLPETLLLADTFMRSRGVIPLIPVDGIVPVVTADPANPRTRAELEFYLDKPVEMIACLSSEIARFFETEPSETSAALNDDQRDLDIARANELAAEGPVIRYVAQLLARAVERRASDIHVEVGESGLRLRFRIEGLLEEIPVDRSLKPDAILARIKVMAGMNVVERRLPQDGRITSVFAGRSVDFRVSTVPTQFGESIVARVLDPHARKLDWDALGFDPEIKRKVIDLIERPSGLFLVTGPTGSGKTTTLYTALAHLNTPERKIITVEDPIEYSVPGIEQVQVNAATGLSFARVLRAVLRQDPDIVMVGEIRDAETAEIACRAALIGRLVLSTLHTRSADAAVTRLVDLGVERYLVEHVLIGVLGQRLEAANAPLVQSSASMPRRRLELDLVTRPYSAGAPAARTGKPGQSSRASRS